MSAEFPRTQKTLQEYIRRKDRRMQVQALWKFAFFGIPVCALSPLIMLTVLGVSEGVCLFAGFLFWLVEGCLYFWGPEDWAGTALGFWLVWAAVVYIFWLGVYLCRVVRRLFPWEPVAVAVLPTPELKEPAEILQAPANYRIPWTNKFDKAWFADVALRVDKPGYYAFSVVVENPSAKETLDILSSPAVYIETSSQVELRSVHRLFGKFQPGVYRLLIVIPGGGPEPEAYLSQISEDF